MRKYKFSGVLLVSALVLMTSCSKDNDKPESENKVPAVSCKEKTATVNENAGTLEIPLNLTKAVEFETVVYVAVKKNTVSGGLEGAPYATIPAEVTLAKGATEGVISLQIVDNQTPNSNCSFDLQLTRVEGEAQIDTTAATCRITIIDDDAHHSVRFGGSLNTEWPEEAGYIEIPLVFGYGNVAEKKISGTIIVDSTYGCEAADFELLAPDFTVNGEDTLKVKIRLVDNQRIGNWGFRLTFKDLEGAWPLTSSYLVKVKDDERILGFQSTTYTVDEGANLDVIPYLYGGLARTNVPLNVEVVPELTTALPVQYIIPKTVNAIYANTFSSSFILRTFKHPSREDKVLAIKITTTVGTTSPGMILTDTTQVCKITIKSTDAFVRFAKKEVTDLVVGTNNIPLETSGYREEMTIHVGVKSSTMNAEDYQLESNFVKIPAGLKSGHIQLKLLKAMQPGDQIILEMTSVVLSNSGTANEEMDPDNMTCTCRSTQD